MNQEYKNYLAVSWDKVLSNEEDIIKLFKELELQNYKDIKIISRNYSNDNRLIMLIEVSNINNNISRIIIDATAGIPTWQQFINITYDDGQCTDLKIILYGKNYDDYSFDLPAGGIFELCNLVRRNNKCSVETYLIKGVEINSDGLKNLADLFVEEGPDDVDEDKSDSIGIDKKLKLPPKIEIQKAEFWAGYYYPNWEMQGGEPIDADDDITGDWEPGYSLHHGLSTKAVWNSDGFFIDLIGEPASDSIMWIWNNRKYLFQNAYPNLTINLKSEDDKPYALSFKMLDIPIGELITMKPDDKWEYGELVYSEEHKFVSVAEEAISDYEEANKGSEIAVV